MYYLRVYTNALLNRLAPATYVDKKRRREQFYFKPILCGQAGNNLLAALVEKNAPLMVSRLGASELHCVQYYLQDRRTRGGRYPGRIRQLMSNNAGFFPSSDELLDGFCELFVQGVRDVDAMGVWFNDYEDAICNTYCPGASLVELICLDSFMFNPPWSRMLSGKTVLVVHPFSESITKQYTEKRRLLFQNQDVLPEFELKTLKAVQSIAGSRVDFANWFEAYEHMCDAIAATRFDVAIIGAGAYGLPLASFAKRMGRQAIHIGGATQLLFGIRGRRWETEWGDTHGKIFNEHWIRPTEAETPVGHAMVDKGAYW